MTMLGAIAVLVAFETGVVPTMVRVASDSQCPSAHAVQEALDALGGRLTPRPCSASVLNHGARLTVELAWSGDPQSEMRELAVESDCDSRAQSAAVVIASWLGALPEVGLVTSSPKTPTEVQVAKSGVHESGQPPVEAPTVAPTTKSHARPSEAPSLSDKALSGSGSRGVGRSWLGVGVGGSAGGGVIPGARIEYLRASSSAGFHVGWMASALASMPRSQSLDGGTSSWMRPALALTGTASWGGDRVRLAMDLGALAGFTVAWGSGYPANHMDSSPTWGVTCGLRLQVNLTSSVPWVELRVIDWLHAQGLQHDIQPTGIVSTTDLPPLEAVLSLGWSFAI